MLFLKKHNISRDDIIIGLIILLAAFLRLFRFWDIPFMHDEFSAILRSQYDSFGDLIKLGVYPDSHPAGVQIFIYYWIKFFGLNEWSLKLPFIFSGIVSVYLIYKLANIWFGKESAIFSSLLLAILQFTIFYSQLARPYSPGLMFVLLSTIYWTKLVFHKDYNSKNILLYVFAACMASYIHAFSLFFIVVQGITGLFFISNKDYIKYILINSLLIILYIPHINIFITQIERGGIGGWLSQPTPKFFLEFLSYTFHYSQVFYFVIIASVFFLSTSSINKKNGAKNFRLISIVWILLSYLTAYFYSIYRVPIIQFSTLLFVYPYFIILLFSFVGKQKSQMKFGFLIVIAIVGIFSLVSNRQHYKLMYKQGFDGIAQNMSNDLREYKALNTSIILQAPNYAMFNYYFEKNNMDTNYFKSSANIASSNLSDYLSKNKPEIVLYGWADYETLSNLALLKDTYKYVLKRENFFNSEYFVFSNTFKEEAIDKDISYSHKINSIEEFEILNSEKPGFSKSLIINTDSLQITKYSVFNVVAKISNFEAGSDALLVMDLQDKKGKSIWWTSSKLSDFYVSLSSGIFGVYHSRRVLNNYPISKGSILKAYIWKRDKSLLEVESIEFYISNIKPIEFGLYNPLISN
ncbi:MAG: hypothetical protein C0598_03320 [Marinilabiliales bacterium]|nr:MAG: hypothetical protein C0598_03320 [Marinilabiliales bacterium]